MVTQLTANGGCATWSNLTTPGDYTVTEADANETNWHHSTGGTSMIMLASGGSETRMFGNYCLSPSGGLTLGFWSNKNGNKLLGTLMVDAGNTPDPFTAAHPGDWRAAFRTIAVAHRRQLLEHPWLVGEISSRPAIGPNTLRVADRILGVALTMGLDATAAGSVVSTLLRYVRGAAADELAELDAERRTGMSQGQWRARSRRTSSISSTPADTRRSRR